MRFSVTVILNQVLAENSFDDEMGRSQMSITPKLTKCCGAVSAILPFAFGSALAQTGDGAAGQEIEEIVITGTRLVIDGNSAPTPVTVVTGEELLNINPNIVDAVRQLPQLVSSSSEQSLSRALDQLRSERFVASGDRVVVVCGTHQLSGATNMMKVESF